jgi:hypothetical protein
MSDNKKMMVTAGVLSAGLFACVMLQAIWAGCMIGMMLILCLSAIK